MSDHPSMHHSGVALFVRYTCAMRALGFCTGLLGVASAMHGQGASAVWLLLLVLSCLTWPLLAWRLSAASADPLRAEFRNLTVDTALAGFWVAMAQFDLLPTALLVAVMAMDRTVAGGWKLARRSMGAMAGVAVATSALNGFAFQPHTRFATMLWCLPFLVLYLLAIGVAARTFAEKVRAQKRTLEHVSRIDAETGLATRPQWLAQVASQLQRFRRYGAVSSLLMIDIDEFKRINDTHGHLAGDQVIREVSALLHASLRGVDSAGRYGGDEFGVLLPGTDHQAALEMAERLRQAVADRVAVGGVPVTLSIGVAELQPGMDTIEDWSGAADEALYRAKADDRNCVRG
ncbi:sensor domain-containing diguanylate cyclase [Pseudoxanthomonas broegbernensis]|nr:sensor domain-containing diguanylate cyclase [Pseudoxanthomonas broegbernensis]MBB6066108.1 diguanylate cyclase [Pseudoxanthomonas broegbernensis]